MRRAPSAVTAIGGFGIGVALLSVAATASIVLIAPEPDEVRYTIRDAARALGGGGVSGLERATGGEPAGRRALLFELVLADRLGREPADVRLVMTTTDTIVTRFSARRPPAAPAPAAATNQPVVIIGNRARVAGSLPTGPGRIVLRSDDMRVLNPSVLPDPSIRAGLASLPLAPFVAAVRQPDGRWLTVRPAQPLLSGWRLRVLAAILVSLVLIVPLAWIFARRLTRPFRALARAVDTSAATIPIDGPRELREAAAAIAAMRFRLADEAAERTRMLTAIAHDLRTPLTGLRLRIEAVAEPQRARMVADVDRMGAMIGEVLDFARDAERAPAPLALRPLLVEIVAEMDAGRGMVALLPGADAAVDAPAPTLRRVVENLVRNALDYAGGGTVTLATSGGAVVVAVADAGPGIAADDRARLLQPFERGEASRNRDTGGAGLGLSIVAAFATRHGGGFALRDRPGGGTVAELRLPASGSPIQD